MASVWQPQMTLPSALPVPAPVPPALGPPPGTAEPVGWSLDPAVTHLNHGSFGAVPVAVQAEQARLRAEMEADPVSFFAGLPPRIASARRAVAGQIGADPQRMAFVANASAGASAVFRSLAEGACAGGYPKGLPARSRGPLDVLVTNHGYGAVTMGAQRLAESTGGRCHIAAIGLAATADEVVELIEAAIAAHRPRLLVIDHITSPTARSFPVAEICVAARNLGVLTLVDGAHAPAMVPDPVCGEADWWVGNLHKFASTPRGSAVLVARSGTVELRPVVDSWGAQLPFPERFDHTGTQDPTAWLAAPFAWRHIEAGTGPFGGTDGGWAAARAYSSDLLDRGAALVAEALRRHGTAAEADSGGAVGPLRLLPLPGRLGSTRAEADALRAPFIDRAGIACAFTHFDGRGYLRLSAHLYNRIEDYARMAEVGVPLLARWARDRP